MSLVDTHAHLQWRSFNRDRSEVIQRAMDAGVLEIINIGYDMYGCESAIRMAESHDGLYAAVGIHPHNANSVNASLIKRLEDLSRHPAVVAIGEIGLDFYRNLSPRETQRAAFQSQLLLARSRGLPVVVHVREAYDEAYEVLSKHSGDITGVMHCWSGSVEMARRYTDLGFYISLAGPVTYDNARKLVDVAGDVPIDKLVVETDCPWLAPQTRRGSRNEPSYLLEIISTIARIRGMAMEDAAAFTTDNARRLFNIDR